MPKVTKRQQTFEGKVDAEKAYAAQEAVKLLKSLSKVKFDESMDIAMNLGVDPKHADQQVRSSVTLPNGNGKTVRVAVFAKGDAATEAEKAGADIVGAEDLAEKIKKGFLDFDRVVAAPDCMPLVGQVGKILGPKGLMPNPKVGTVTPKPGNVVKDIKSGMTEFRCEKNGIIHAQVGKLSFDEKKLVENVQAFFEAVKNAKPEGVKGTYIKNVSLSSSMGPGLKVDVATL